MAEDDLLTIDEIAQILRTSKAHVFRLMRQRELAVIRRGRRFTRIQRNDLNAFLDRYRREATASKETET